VLSAGLLDGDAFITDRIPLSEVTRALDVVRRGQGVKTQLIPQ
jgi:Zn-dependent alcohol dehydrogenase